MIASRTGVRLTPSSRASSASESRWPGVRCNEMIEARRASYASTRVVRDGRVRLIGSILLGDSLYHASMLLWQTTTQARLDDDDRVRGHPSRAAAAPVLEDTPPGRDRTRGRDPSPLPRR